MPVAAIGSLLQQSDMASPPNWTTIASVGSITTSYMVDNVDVTNQDSPNRTKQKFPVLIDTKDVSFDLFEDPLDATHQLLFADAQAFTVRDYRLLIPTSPQKKRIYHAFVSDLSDSFAVNNVIKATVKLTNYSAPDFNAA